MDAGTSNEVGYQRLSASGVIGDSGKPIALYGIIFKSGGTAGNPTFANGTAASNTAVFDLTGTINQTTVASLSGGIVFPLGLNVTVDGNTSYVVCYYRQILS